MHCDKQQKHEDRAEHEAGNCCNRLCARTRNWSASLIQLRTGRLKEFEQLQGSWEPITNRRANAQQTRETYVGDKMFCAKSCYYFVTAADRVCPVAMQAACECDRLERLERAVEQLQKRNAELEVEVRSVNSKLPLGRPANS